jgi:hypothetical protein
MTLQFEIQTQGLLHFGELEQEGLFQAFISYCALLALLKASFKK